jgi:hypothetical protein
LVNNFESFQKMRCFSLFTLLDARTWLKLRAQALYVNGCSMIARFTLTWWFAAYSKVAVVIPVTVASASQAYRPFPR